MALTELVNYCLENSAQIFQLLIEHIRLTVISVGFAILIGVPLGILISYVKKLNKPILSVANIIQAIPSMALLGFMIPLFGIGVFPAIIAVILYSLLPVIKNTFTGIDNINPQTIEAAKGIGLTKFQILTKVQIPMALPVIMAGVRISAVTAVGLMTMAAFIGAGGLGFLVFSGIRTVNTYQIIAGAIPACILALCVDFLFAVVEKLVTPISLQKGEVTTNAKKRHTHITVFAVAALVVAFSFIFPMLNTKPQGEKVISVGSKDFTEQAVLGNLVSELIEEKTDITVKRNLDLGGTQVVFSAMKAGDIDMYIEYSGSAYTNTLKYPPISDTQKVYNTVKEDFKKQFGIDVLQQMNFNNTYTLAVPQATAEKYQLETLSDFAKVADQFKAGITYEFINREDGLIGLQKAYGFNLKESVALDGAPRYTALLNKKVDIVDAFATDGLLKKFGLVTLADDQSFFPPYYAMPIVREEVTEKYPEIIPVLEQLGELLTNDVMSELNYNVDELGQAPDVVAHNFLVKQGLVS